MRRDFVMITGIGATGGRPLEQLRTDKAAPKAAPAPATTVDESDATPVSAASELAAAGAPVDLGKIAQIKAGIANGSYKADPDAIAAKMIALDLPTK